MKFVILILESSFNKKVELCSANNPNAFKFLMKIWVHLGIISSEILNYRRKKNQNLYSNNNLTFRKFFEDCRVLRQLDINNNIQKCGVF